MKAIITCGGKGTRMQPLTFSMNKHFIPLANKPLIFYAIETVTEAGVKEIGINYNPGQLEEIKSWLGDKNRWGVKFHFILQDRPAGLAHIIQVSQDFLKGEKFIMHLGDNIFYGGIRSLVDYFLKNKLNALVPMLHHQENSRMGVPYFDKKGRLVKLVEKPKNPPHDLAIPGLYLFDSNVFKCFSGKDSIKPSARGELEIVSPFQWLIDRGYRVEAKEFSGIWKDPGKFNDWLDTNQFLLDKEIQTNLKSKLGRNTKTEGRIKIGKGCKIRNSFLRGPIIIGDKVIIENSFIGPYSSIWDEVKIIDAKMENCVLMKRVLIQEPTKPLDTCLIGEESIIQGGNGVNGTAELFIGNRCSVKF